MSQPARPSTSSASGAAKPRPCPNEPIPERDTPVLTGMERRRLARNETEPTREEREAARERLRELRRELRAEKKRGLRGRVRSNLRERGRAAVQQSMRAGGEAGLLSQKRGRVDADAAAGDISDDDEARVVGKFVPAPSQSQARGAVGADAGAPGDAAGRTLKRRRAEEW
jgi:hypothetical protein